MRIILACMLAWATSIPAQTWEKINSSGTRYSFSSLGVDGMDVVTLFGNNGTTWSTDQGKTWSIASSVKKQYNGMTLGGGQSILYAIAVHPDGDLFTLEAILDARSAIPAAFTVFRSTDHGFNWTNTIGNLPSGGGPVMNMISAPNGHLYLFVASLFVSADKGKTWQEKGDLAHYGKCVADPESQLYCLGYKAGGTETTLFRSRDDGSTWDSLFADSGITALAANQKGSVAVWYNGTIAAMTGGDSAFRISQIPFPNGNGPDGPIMAIAPDGSILVENPSHGIMKVSKALDSYAQLNAGLGADSAGVQQFAYDSKGNLYSRADQSAYLIRAGGSPIRVPPALAIKPGDGRIYDLKGRPAGAYPSDWGWRIKVSR